jgi:hypothetical protein
MRLKESLKGLGLAVKNDRIKNDRSERQNNALCVLSLNITNALGIVIPDDHPEKRALVTYSADRQYKLSVYTDTFVGFPPNCFITLYKRNQKEASRSHLLSLNPPGRIPDDTKYYSEISMRNPGYACNHDVNPESAMHWFAKTFSEPRLNGQIKTQLLQMKKEIKVISDALRPVNAKTNAAIFNIG